MYQKPYCTRVGWLVGASWPLPQETLKIFHKKKIKEFKKSKKYKKHCTGFHPGLPPCWICLPACPSCQLAIQPGQAQAWPPSLPGCLREESDRLACA